MSSDDICGIIMPIGAMPPRYSPEHWSGVRKALERAIQAAEMVPQAVWENQPNDIIQGKILKNLYENEVIVCDVSGLNPNVMLELGMRLATGRPTILVADGTDKLPFDTSVISHSFYPPSLEYHSTAKFLDELTEKICRVRQDYQDGKYRSFAQNFDFTVVAPKEIPVTAESYIIERLDAVEASISRIADAVSKPIRLKDLIVSPSAILETANDFAPDISTAQKAPPRDDIEIGTRVFHSKFGYGVVVEQDGNKLEIEFGAGIGQKRVLDSFVSLSSE